MMRLVDEVYEFYRERLNDNEEDAIAVVLNLLEGHNREDLLRLINEMKEDEIFQMVALYMVELLKMKIIHGNYSGNENQSKRLH
jgi:hypothetical protein